MLKLVEKAKGSKVVRNIFMFVTPISLAILLIMVYNLSQTVQHLSEQLINRTTDRTQQELDNFFNPVISNLLTAKDWCKSEKLEISNVSKINTLYIPILKNSTQMSSMHMADTFGNELMILKEDSTWQNRLTMSGKSHRYIWDYSYGKGVLLNEFVLESDSSYNPKARKWYEIVQFLNHESFTWTKPYIFSTTHDLGITASIKVFNDVKKDPFRILAFDIKLTDISLFTSHLQISKKGKAFILNREDLVIGLPADPRFVNRDTAKKYVLSTKEQLGIAEVTESIRQWQMNGRSTNPFKFQSKGVDWWGGFQQYRLPNGAFLYIAVIVPEKDFMEEMQRTQFIIIGGFALVLILTLLVIRSYNQKQKAYALLALKNQEILLQKEEIQAQRDEIAEIHKDLSQSIDYATKIQTAILPLPQTMENNFTDYFVLFRPKDKVSGDFYWWKQSNNHMVITVADCTGHGVPGAFMSMLGTSFLNEVVAKESVTNPAQIIGYLRKEIIQALKQKGASGEQKDGMDMSLISINLDSLLLHYSGANNPLFLIRNEDTMSEPKLIEFKADKMPVAIHDIMVDYQVHEIQLQKGDCLYLMSDGYQDQFGGPNDKKFLVKRLKELLISIHDLSMATQQNLLESSLIAWIGNGKQIDDVTILGIRI